MLQRAVIAVLLLLACSIAVSGCLGGGHTVPEFSTPRTDQDQLPANAQFEQQEIDAETVRYVGTISGVDLYVAQSNGPKMNYCLVVVGAGVGGLSVCSPMLPISVDVSNGRTTVIFTIAGVPEGYAKLSQSVSYSTR